jgi:hypothetical protein
MVKDKRPPIDNPLRNPGQSIQQQVIDLLGSEVFLPFLIIAITLTSAFMAWLPIIFNASQVFMAIFLTIVFIFVTPFSILKIHKAIEKAKNFKLGQDGEKTVAEYLNKMHSSDCYILHDIPGKNYNIDHVIVSTKGIFAIETKTRSKMIGKNEVVTFDGSTIKIGKYEAKEIIQQAALQRKTLGNIIENVTGQTFPIKSIVTFPGWYVDPIGYDKTRTLFVCNHKIIETTVHGQPETMNTDDINLVTKQLEKYIRNFVE